MLQKRQLEEEQYDVSSKQPRYQEPCDERISVPDFHAYQKSGTECEEMHDGGYDSELPAGNENEIVKPYSPSNCLGTASTAGEEDDTAEAPYYVVYSPDHYDVELPVTTIIHSKELYSYLLERSPQKLVPVGEEFQAEIPEWVGCGEAFPCSSSRDASQVVLDVVSKSPKLDSSDNSTDGDKFIGSCVLPMLEGPLSTDVKDIVGAGRTSCSCEDKGSIRCVQHHINEAREKLRESIGCEAFTKLEFGDMGEVVAEKWSEYEEDKFREIVFRNAAFRRNFWDELTSEFPSRTKKEIISYYFNVFMLRKRAEQNRVDMFDIDSDNDMWEGAHFFASDGNHDQDASDGSGDEYPEQEDEFGHEEIYDGTNSWKRNEVSALETSEDETQDNLGRINNTSLPDTYSNDVFEHCSSGSAHPPFDQDISEGLQKQHTEARNKDHGIRHWPSNLNGHEFPIEHCTSKEWDVGYLTCPKDEDFLPTCSMIEEVFGSGVCNYKN